MAELSENVKMMRQWRLAIANPGWWLRLGASAALVAWFAAVVWGMLGSFDITQLSGQLLNFNVGGPLARIFTIPHWDVLAAHALLLLAASWLTLLAIVLGVWAGRLLGLRLGAEPPLLGIGLAAALGYAVVCLLFTLLNLSGLLYGWLVWALTLLASAGTLLWLVMQRGLLPWWRAQQVSDAVRNTLAGVKHPVRNFIPFVLLFAMVASAFLALGTALAPPVLYDTMLYHLAMPRQYVAHHGFVPVYAEMVILFAQGMEFIYTWPLTLFGGDNWAAGSIAGVMHWWMGILTTIGAYGFCRALGLSRRVGLLAAAAFLVQPLVNREIGTAYVDVGNAFFTLFCLYALYRWWQTEHSGWLTAAALLAGTAAAVKVFGAPLILLTITTVIARWWRKRRSSLVASPAAPLPNSPPQGGRESDNSALSTQHSALPYLRLAVIGGLIGGLTASYSYITSWLVLGNPLWPELNGIFHGWTSAIADANNKQLVSYLFYSVDQGPMQFSAGGMFKYLFWNLWIDQASQMRGGMTVPRTIPLTTALMPVALIIGFIAVVRWAQGRQVKIQSRSDNTHPVGAQFIAPNGDVNSLLPNKIDPALWWGFGYALAFIVLWFLLQGQRRYILFTLPLLGAGIGWVWEKLRAKLPLAALGFSLFIVVMMYVGTLSNLAFNFRAFSNVYGLMDDHFYVLEGATIRLGEGGQTMLYLNRVAPSNQTVLITELTAPLYYLGRDYIMTHPGWDDFLHYGTLQTAADFLARLNEYNVSYMVDMREQNYLDPLMEQGMWLGRNKYMHLVYTQGNWYTYQRDLPTPPTGLKLGSDAGRVGVVGFAGGVPTDLPDAINLDGLDRMKPDTLAGLNTIVVKRNVPPVAHTNLDVLAVYAPDAATIGQRLAQTATLVQSVGDYDVYHLDGAGPLVGFGMQSLPLNAANWQISSDESQAAILEAGSTLTLTLPLTSTLTPNPPQTKLDVDRQGDPIPGLSAIVESGMPPTDLNGATTLLVDVQVSSGAMLRVAADIDGKRVGLNWRFNGSGDGVSDEMVMRLPDGAKTIANLTFMLSAPQGGTGNLIAGKLDTSGGQGTVRAVFKSIALLK